MAGGKLTPRQKMINLMYLVFIAMLALNMSKEVLTAFGLMNEKFDTSNNLSNDSNEKLLTMLASKASEDPAKFDIPNKNAIQIANISKTFYAYLGSLKSDVTKTFPTDQKTGKLPFEAMDKSTIDEVWFSGDGYSAKGNEIVGKFDAYIKGIKGIVGTDPKFQVLVKDLEKKFSTLDIKDGEGVTKKYLDYHFKGFPAIATTAKLTALQNDVKSIEGGAYNIFIGNTFKEAASMKNYTAIVVPEKSAFFQGESVKGVVYLGRFDKSTVPTSVTVSGGSTKIVSGQAQFTLGAGNVGEHDITGNFNFLEDGKNIQIPIKGNYVVVPKPNQAIVSADKMNVVYRGVPNPISVSVPGVAANLVKANAQGMSAGPKPGQYLLRPGSGADVTVNVSASLPNGGGSFSSKQIFRIKGLPAPTGKIRGEVAAKGSKSNLQACTVSAVMEDFDFPVTVNVTQFNIKVPGQPTVVVSGSKMDSRARSAIERATRGDLVVISEIKASFSGIDQVAKRVSSCTYEVQ